MLLVVVVVLLVMLLLSSSDSFLLLLLLLLPELELRGLKMLLPILRGLKMLLLPALELSTLVWTTVLLLRMFFVELLLKPRGLTGSKRLLYVFC